MSWSETTLPIASQRRYGSGFTSLKPIATIWLVRYSAVDARHRFAQEKRERKLRSFRWFRVHAYLDFCHTYCDRILHRQVRRNPPAVLASRARAGFRNRSVSRLPDTPRPGCQMSDHWRVALRCAAFMVVLVAVVAGVMFYVYSPAGSLAFCYGAGVGIVSFVSTAVTVSLLTGRSKYRGILVGATSFGARYGFAAVALSIPAYLDLWPTVAMFVGFTGVYFVETVMLVPWAIRATKISGVDSPVVEGRERRIEV